MGLGSGIFMRLKELIGRLLSQKPGIELPRIVVPTTKPSLGRQNDEEYFDHVAREVDAIEADRLERIRIEGYEAMKRIILFPGGKDEFEDFSDMNTVWVDVGIYSKGLMFDNSRDFQGVDMSTYNPFSMYGPDFVKTLASLEICALVNARPYSGDGKYYFGIPVSEMEDDGEDHDDEEVPVSGPPRDSIKKGM